MNYKEFLKAGGKPSKFIEYNLTEKQEIVISLLENEPILYFELKSKLGGQTISIKNVLALLIKKEIVSYYELGGRLYVVRLDKMILNQNAVLGK